MASGVIPVTAQREGERGEGGRAKGRGGGGEGGGGTKGGEGERGGREDMIGLERDMCYTIPHHDTPTRMNVNVRGGRKQACLPLSFSFSSILFFSLFSSVLFLLCTVSLYHAHAERGEITEDEGTPPDAP